MAGGAATELGDFVMGGFELLGIEPGRAALARDGEVVVAGHRTAVRVEKVVTLGGDRRSPSLALDVQVENRSTGDLDVRLAIELALTMLGGGGNPAAWWEVGGSRSGHDGSGAVAGATELVQGNEHIGVAVRTTIEPAADAAWAPIETISNSEAGFERVYQGSALVLSWLLHLGPGDRRSFRVGNAVTAAYDRTSEELAAG
jgi:alpha-amylase